MFVKSLVGIGLAVFLGACAADDARSEATSSTEQALLWACTGDSTWTRYWSQSGIEVGREDCDCTGTVTAYGTLAGTYSQVLGSACSGGGGGGGGGDGCLAAPAGGSINNPPPICP